jgi:NIMA (never in mitosis gene a)-related kinase 1/4/5
VRSEFLGDSNNEGLTKYRYKEGLGQGVTGQVNLYVRMDDNSLHAIKEIDLQYLSEKEKKDAESEVQFLKVLKGPTIIKFTESFIQKNKIYIVMEYASEGTLAQAIDKKKEQRKNNGVACFTP